MYCTGHCFDIARFEATSILDEPNEEGWAASAAGPSETYMYTPLKSWQTRILRLHPSQDSSLAPLSADLLVATVSDTEGIVIEQAGAPVEYTALSYTWGYPQLSETLICNRTRKAISGSNAAALAALRRPNESIYVWIDAICINQDDVEEKSAQVARMLNIYQKAYSVTAWLGEPDNDSLLAFACCRKLGELQKAVSQFRQTTHELPCFDHLRAIHLAIFSLYNRPWLRRT
jgi:hypothetical protein